MKKSILLFLWAAFVVSATVTAVTLGTHANQSDHAMTASVHAMAHAPPLVTVQYQVFFRRQKT